MLCSIAIVGSVAVVSSAHGQAADGGGAPVYAIAFVVLVALVCLGLVRTGASESATATEGPSSRRSDGIWTLVSVLVGIAILIAMTLPVVLDDADDGEVMLPWDGWATVFVPGSAHEELGFIAITALLAALPAIVLGIAGLVRARGGRPLRFARVRAWAASAAMVTLAVELRVRRGSLWGEVLVVVLCGVSVVVAVCSVPALRRRRGTVVSALLLAGVAAMQVTSSAMQAREVVGSYSVSGLYDTPWQGLADDGVRRGSLASVAFVVLAVAVACRWASASLSAGPAGRGPRAGQTRKALVGASAVVTLLVSVALFSSRSKMLDAFSGGPADGPSRLEFDDPGVLRARASCERDADGNATAVRIDDARVGVREVSVAVTDERATVEVRPADAWWTIVWRGTASSAPDFEAGSTDAERWEIDRDGVRFIGATFEESGAEGYGYERLDGYLTCRAEAPARPGVPSDPNVAERECMDLDVLLYDDYARGRRFLPLRLQADGIRVSVRPDGRVFVAQGPGLGDLTRWRLTGDGHDALALELTDAMVSESSEEDRRCQVDVSANITVGKGRTIVGRGSVTLKTEQRLIDQRWLGEVYAAPLVRFLGPVTAWEPDAVTVVPGDDTYDVAASEDWPFAGDLPSEPTCLTGADARAIWGLVRGEGDDATMSVTDGSRAVEVAVEPVVPGFPEAIEGCTTHLAD